MEAGKRVKVDGLENNLLELIAADQSFGMDMDSLKKLLKPENYVGRSREQVTDFINDEVAPVLEKNAAELGVSVEINV